MFTIKNFEEKYVIFSKKLLCKVSMFFIHRLASKKAYQSQKEEQIVDDVIIRR
jgi:hypothetical protein